MNLILNLILLKLARSMLPPFRIERLQPVMLQHIVEGGKEPRPAISESHYPGFPGFHPGRPARPELRGKHPEGVE